MIENVEYDVDKPPDSYFSKVAVIVFNEIDSGNDGVLASSRFVDFIETLDEGFNIEELAGHIWKAETNESGGLDCFDFVRWYMDEEVYLHSTEEAERLVL